MKFALLALVALAACYKTEYSSELREPGKVEEISFAPGGSGTTTSYDLTGKGGLSVGDVDIPDRYGVVISCKHGKFRLKPQGETAKAMWEKLHVGDSITIHYREVYHVQDGVKELADLDFIDATKR